MSKETKKHTREKNRPVGRISYLPYGAKGYGTTFAAVFATSRPDCQSIALDNVPMDFILDKQRGMIGSFFIWEVKEKESGA